MYVRKERVANTRNNNFIVTEQQMRMMGVYRIIKPRFNVIDGVEMRNYKGCKGYNDRWGRYIGNLAVMMYYLQWQNPVAYEKYDALLLAHNKKKVNRLTPERLKELKLEVVQLLKPETQRKFMHGRKFKV